jgi:glycosyltransferase involved in cell wall biosynthesis
MRIGVDVRYLSHGILGGVHTYVASLLPQLIKSAEAHELILYADDKCPLELTETPSHVQVRILPWRNPLSSINHDLFMRRQMAADGLDIAHFPANHGFGPQSAATVITVHDEINLLPLAEIIRGHRKQLRTIAMMSYLHWMTTASVRQADLLLTVSAHAGRKIAQYSGFPQERIIPVHHGRSPDFQRIEEPQQLEAVRRKFGLDRPFILADALKNPAVLVRAWAKLPESIRQSYQILFFSRIPNPLPVVGEAVAQNYAKLLIRPSREELIVLYSMACAFAFPSWIEGFGMPILEAMACGAPVLSSNRGSAPEVAGNAALMSDAEDAGEWAAKILRLLTTPALAEQYRQAGFRRVSQFSWRRAAQETFCAYERAFARRRPHRQVA